MRLLFTLLFIACIFSSIFQVTYARAAPARGTQVRMSERMMKYVAGLAIKNIQDDLRNKALPNRNGNMGPASFSATNIRVNNLKIKRQNIDAVGSIGLRLSVHDIELAASARVNARAKVFFATLQDTTNINLNGRGIGFTLDCNIGELDFSILASGLREHLQTFELAIVIDARYSKPHMTVKSCSSKVGDINLKFSGGMAMLYNMFSGMLKNIMKDMFKKMMCDEIKKLVNQNMDNFLDDFPVQQDLDQWAILDYSFEKPLVTNNYVDLYLRGEFLDKRRPIRTKEPPPTFDTVSEYDKMIYLWLSDWTINSAGKIFHKAGLLQKMFSPNQKKDDVPDDVKPFLNTKGCKQIIPMLHKNFPNQPLQFNIETVRPPMCDISPKGIEVDLQIRIKVDLLTPNRPMASLFYIDLVRIIIVTLHSKKLSKDVDVSIQHVNALLNIQIKTINQQLMLAGALRNFKFAAKINSAVIGGINLSLNNSLINVFISAMVVNQANSILSRGFPVPSIPGIDIINPRFTTVQDAIRIDTDIRLLNTDVTEIFKQIGSFG